MNIHKPFDLALVAGRFQHVHIGHEHLIDTALSVADRALVLLGSAQEFGTKRNPFSVVTRASLLREIYPDETKVIIGTITDLSNFPHVSAEWGHHVLQTCKHFTRKLPEVFVYGNEQQNTNWFTCDTTLEQLANNMTEIKVSRHKHGTSGTEMRELLQSDNFDIWMGKTNPKLHKYYDDLRSELLNCASTNEALYFSQEA